MPSQGQTVLPKDYRFVRRQKELGKFKRRWNLIYSKITRGALDVETNVTNDWINNVKDKFAPYDSFNTRE